MLAAWRRRIRTKTPRLKSPIPQAIHAIERTRRSEGSKRPPNTATAGASSAAAVTDWTATELDQVSIETAQSGLDLAVLDSLPDKTIILGALDLSTDEVETPDTVAARIRRAFPHAGPDRLIAAPDCGMKYLPRDAAYGKLEALVAGARQAAEEAVTA